MKVNRNDFQCLYRTANQPQKTFQGWKQCDSYKPKKCQKISGKKRLVVCTFGRLQGQKNLPNSPKTIYSHLENCPKFLEPRFPLIANFINESFLIEITQTFQYKLHPTEPLNKLTLLSRGGWTLRFRGLSGTDFL